jgi:Lon-like ATP-dependent protease
MARKGGKTVKRKPSKSAVSEKSKSASKTITDFKTTADINISKNIIDQVIGQDDAVEVMKKAAKQRRHVLLIGEPGTGKSMLGMGLAEMLPMESLADIISFPNPNDENMPLIRTVKAGEGRKIVSESKLHQNQFFKGGNLLMFALAFVAMIAPWYVLHKYQSEIMFAALFIGGIVFIGLFAFFINFSKRMGGQKQLVPKVIVDNFGRKTAPFMDATGAHAGALLGDVLHDPFQTFFTGQQLQIKSDDGIKFKKINEQIDLLMLRHKNKIIEKENQNYEAIHLPENELLVLSETQGSVSPVEVLSANRYHYNGEMIKLTTSEKKELIVTPEHKIAVWKNGKITYAEAKDIKKNDEVVAKSEYIIDEQDIINTYDNRQQEQCRLYYTYLDIKSKNPKWGYKRIAKSMNQKIGKTRWWHAKRHIPVPIQTVRWLSERELLPLKIDNPKLPLIAKVLGATFGDGGIFENLNGIFLSSSEKKAVEEFGADLEKTFYLCKNENSRIIEGGEYGHSWCCQNTNRNIIRFFLALGAPKGNKTNIELKIPSWIKLDHKLEHEFYGSFMGGELGTPTLHKRGNYLTTLEVGITGLPHLKDNRLSFLKELSEYLRRNRVYTTSIYQGKSKTEGSLVFRLLIEKRFDNILYFMMNIKINYCKYKTERLYKALGQWAMLKKNKYHELIDRRYGAEHAMKILNLTPNSLYLLLNHFGKNEVMI